ncbi:MAG: dUTP diphosphatase [Pyrinomonadaceae bacterium]
MRWPLPLKKLHPHAIVPTYQTIGAAGLDLHACFGEGSLPFALEPGVITRVSCGIAIEIPKDHEGQIRSRSGLAMKGVTVAHGVGTIDWDYRGEIGVLLIYHGAEEYFEINHGDRIAQLVISPVARVDPYVCEDLSPTARGTGGFGSTGV